MKKLIMFFGLLTVSPLYSSMIIRDKQSDREMFDFTKISQQHGDNFVNHLSMAVRYSEQKIKENIIDEKNSIYMMLSGLSRNLKEEFSDSVIKMITVDTDLQSRINIFTVVDSNDLVQFPLQQIKQKAADVDGAKAYLIRTRQILAGLKFLKKEPTYSNAWINEVSKEDRIGFMIRNKDYLLSEKSIRNYWSLFIYQSLIAPMVD